MLSSHVQGTRPCQHQHYRAGHQPLRIHRRGYGTTRHLQGSWVAHASEKAAALLAQGKRVYESGDRLAAGQIYEQALKEWGLSPEQKKAAMYGTIAVHASFGDVELAQMALRDAVQAGLDFEAAQQDPDLPEINSSPQILIQLTRFNKMLLRNMEQAAEDRAVTRRTVQQAAAAGRKSSTRVAADADISQLLGGSAEKKDDLGIDASPLAIARRVALVVLALSGLGVALFLVGLQYLFPQF